MINLDRFSVKITNYKCIKDAPQGFDCLRPLNVIIGRNNSGKSTLLDLIEFACNGTLSDTSLFSAVSSQITFGWRVSAEEITQCVLMMRAQGAFGINNWHRSFDWADSLVSYKMSNGNAGSPYDVMIDHPLPNDVNQTVAGIAITQLANLHCNPLESKIFMRLLADRDMAAEQPQESLTIGPNGDGATNLIREYLVSADKPSNLVETKLLGALNDIFFPDGTFARLAIQQHIKGTRSDGRLDEKWEVYLEEKHKGWIALSKSGSGLKTILLVLCFLHIMPHAENKDISEYIFGFEELENNLHPALQRRLLQYLRRRATEDGCVFLLTTHSHTAIDLFMSDPKAQLLHVSHDGVKASVQTVSSSLAHNKILDDLDVRASDLLQANGIVWLEGPSDRLYFNHWVSLWSNGRLVDGVHYQCLLYGGALRYYLSAASEPPEDEIEMLRINRNMIFITDSDQEDEGTPLDKTKQRILEEIDASTGMGWVTFGRDIENYISRESLLRIYPDIEPDLASQYRRFEEVLEEIEPGSGKRFNKTKVKFARSVLPHITLDDVRSNTHLSEYVDRSCKLIEKWNKMSRQGPTW